MMNMAIITHQCEKLYNTIRNRLTDHTPVENISDDHSLSDEELARLANDLFLELDRQEAPHG